MKVLHLIIARANSKGIPGKNLQTIAGIPLIGFKAIAARRSRYCDRLVISSENEEMQEVGRRYGAEVLFTRPAELAADDASSAAVVSHALDWFESREQVRYDAIMLLEPSAPFARPADLDAAVEMMVQKKANAVVGVERVDVASAFIGPMDSDQRISAVIRRIRGMKDVRRQAQPKEFTANGALYLVRWDFFKQHRSIYCDEQNSYGYVMDSLYSIEIDEPMDIEWARFLVDRGHVDISSWTTAGNPPPS